MSRTIGDVYNSADVAELADARGSGPRSRKGVEVQVLSSAPIDFVFAFFDLLIRLSLYRQSNSSIKSPKG